MRFFILFIILFFQVCSAQTDYFYDYNTNYNLRADTKKNHKLLIRIFFSNLLDYPNFYYNHFDEFELEQKNFDLRSNKLVKKVTFYDISTYTGGKSKYFELEFLENGKIKFINDFVSNTNHTFEYQNKLQIRKRSKLNDNFTYSIDSLFFNDNNNLTKFYHNSKNSFNNISITDKIFYEYDKNDNLISRYNLIGSNGKIIKYYYHKDSIVEKRFSLKNISSDKNIIPDTLEINKLKMTYFLSNKKRVSKIAEKWDNSKPRYYYFEHNKNNQIISLKRDDKLIYRFEFDKKGRIIKAINVNEELTDIYQYYNNDYLEKANADKYYYKFDEFGNWIDYYWKNEDYEGAGNGIHYVREIEYY